MECPTAAVSFARALLALARARASGVLRAQTELGRAELVLECGVVCGATAVPGADRMLGDVLLAGGALDARAHSNAVAELGEAQVPVGAWLVGRGLATRPAVDAALRQQLRERVLRLFDCAWLDYGFERALDGGRPACIDERPATADLVLCALRARARDWSVARCASAIPPGPLCLNALGRELERAALWPEEAVAMALLARGTTLAGLCRATHGSLRALRLTAVLGLLSALGEARANARPYTLLLRKRGQVRARLGAYVLLDLPPGAAPHQARRALHKLAARMHPDTLGPSAPDALRRASNEVLRALLEAERALRATPPRARG